MEDLVVSLDFWKGKRVLLTGHTGFKGSWLSLWLQRLGAEIVGYALESPTEPSLYRVAEVERGLSSITADIRDMECLQRAFDAHNPEIVIHMAAQSLVRDSYADPVGTYRTNVMGTVNFLESARKTASVKGILIITSDKCYENKEWVWGYRENEAMGGYDPYSSSKGCAELVTSAYRRSFMQDAGIAVATARAGNVIGGGDWAKDRIVPDAISAFIENNPLIIRNPKAIRPWQHVLEPLSGYLMLCQQLINHPEDYAGGWNFGPNDEDARPVSILADILVKFWGNNAQWKLDDGANPHEAQYLKLDCTRAKTLLKWKSIWGFNRTIDETVKWYESWHSKKDMHKFTLQQIEAYQQEHLAE